MLALLTGRVGRLAAQAVVLSAVVGGTIAFAGSGKKVLLSVDGSTREVEADAGTVRALLAAENLQLGSHDLVAPALNTPLSDGDKVVVRYGRKLVVTVDGQTHTYWTTEVTVDRALAALGIHADDARFSVSRGTGIGRQGLNLDLTTPKSVTIAADGLTRSMRTTAPTVADLLAEQGLRVGAADRLSVVAATPVTDGLVVALTRITRSTVTATEQVPFDTQHRSTDTLDAGQTKVLTPGKYGRRTAVYAVVLANGKVVGRTLVSATVLTAPVSQVVAVGTKPVPATAKNVGGNVDSLNWAALARCESGGNPKAVNPAGYYGLYQFSLSTWHSMGGSGNPVNASAAEQTYRAKLLYQKAGAGQWGCGAKLFS